MATRGTVTSTAWKGTYGNRYIGLTWERESIDVGAQTSTISWQLVMYGTNTSTVTSKNFQVIIDGETVFSDTTKVPYAVYDEIASGTHTIQHNTDGTKTFTITIKGVISNDNTSVSGSGNFTLEPVGKAKIIAAPNFTDEDNPTIAYENTVGNTITSIAAAISLTGETPDIAYREVNINGGSYTFNLTDAERKILRAATQGSNSRKVRFYLRSIVGEEYYFSWMEVTFTVVNAMPTIEGIVMDINENTQALTGDVYTLIRYHSTAYAVYRATAYKEATIKTNVIEYNGTLTSDTIKTVENVESNVFSFISSDSRGNTANETIVAPMIDYIRPTANIDTAQQMTAEGAYTLRVSGNYFNDTFGYTSASAANTLTVKYRYKAQGGSYGSWVTLTPTKNGNTYSAAANLTGLDYRTAYVFQCQVIDKLNTILSAEITVRSLPLFHWGANNFVFEVPVTFNAGAEGISGGGSSGDCAIQNGIYTGDLKVTGDLWLKGSGNYGNRIYFGDKSYTYIQETPDDTLNIKATKVQVNGRTLEHNFWVPALNNANAVQEYTEQMGWYMMMGAMVTIGWQIKAIVKPGYDSNILSITGLPKTPAMSAFGGGIAHNVYMSNGFCFEGYVVGEDGNITLRGQPCNPTAAGNLNITSGVYYPKSTANTVVTLGGTITYITGE